MAEAREISDDGFLELQNAIKSYSWGKLGLDSKACQFYIHNCPDFVHISTTPYAELWVGAHINGPSLLKKSGESLEHWISRHPKALGEEVVNMFDKKLPFLMKILSVRKTLSIQAHPDKLLAKHLHNLKPNIYKDDNHKPEMLIALSDFSAMFGFRPIKEIAEFVRNVPEVRTLLGERVVDNLKITDKDKCNDGLMNIFSQLMTAPKNLVRQQIAKLKTRFEKNGMSSALEDIVNELASTYPEDVGVFCPYLLNILHLEKGEAIFIPANEPHAYICGDGVECMAASDNVVRAGLTDKLVDKETIIGMLSYKCKNPDETKIKGFRETQYSRLFRPPVQDFAVSVIDIPPQNVVLTLPTRHSASLLMIVEGDARGNESIFLKKGNSFFLSANFSIRVSQSEQRPQLLMFQAFVNV